MVAASGTCQWSLSGSFVGGVFMGSVVNGLELDGRVLDAEVGVDARLDLVEEFAEVAVVEGLSR